MHSTGENDIKTVEQLVQQHNHWRLTQTLNLIASENMMSLRARNMLLSDFTHRYAEGHPGARYYQGTQYIDQIEAKVEEVLRQLFHCSRVEVRTISGTHANEVVFSTFLKKGGRALAHALPSGAHISHLPFGALGKYADAILNFPLAPDGYHIDVAKAKDLVAHRKPKVIILGRSVFLFPEPITELVDVCREKKTRIIYDGAHVLGLIAGKQFQAPLTEGADILMGSTHKTFFGPQRGIIASNLDDETWAKIDKRTFPGSVSNHHLYTLPPLLISSYEMDAFGEAYAQQVISNAQALAKALDSAGLPVEAREWGYTQSHQVIVNVQNYGGGNRVSETLQDNDIIVNRNVLAQNSARSVINPSGIRLGVQELTRLGMKEDDMAVVARLMKECIVDNKNVKSEVNRWREPFQQIHYSFDPPSGAPEKPALLAEKIAIK